MSAFFNNPEMLRNARIPSWRGDVTGPVCKVEKSAQRYERLYSRISSGEVM